MLKKILISILSLSVLTIGGLVLYNHVRHKPVYGIVALDKDDKKLNDSITAQKRDIEKSAVVSGKWVEHSKTLVLNVADAKKIVALKGIQKVTVSKNDYTFTPLKTISENESSLFSKKNTSIVTDETNKEFSPKIYEYATLGESSAYVNNLFILPTDQYNEFTGSPISLALLKIKTDASKALINYNELDISQLYDESRTS